MVAVTFPDRATEKRALAVLVGRFSGQVLKSGEHLIPEAALKALEEQNIAFAVIMAPPPRLQLLLEAARRRIQADAGIPEKEFWEDV